MQLEHFDPSEFDSPDQPGSGALEMDAGFLTKIDRARHLARVAFVVSSGYRTVRHNRKVGGVPDSEHCSGHAADVLWSGSLMLVRIVWAASRVGFDRIGVKVSLQRDGLKLTLGGFVHLGDSPRKPSPAFWGYGPLKSHKV